MNLLTDLNAFLKTKISAPGGKVYQDFFPTATEALISRRDPSAAKEINYIDGSCTGEQLVSYQCRSASMDTAIATLQAVQKALDLKQFPITEGLIVTSDEQSEIVPISKSDANVYIYACSMRITYTKE